MKKRREEKSSKQAGKRNTGVGEQGQRSGERLAAEEREEKVS